MLAEACCCLCFVTDGQMVSLANVAEGEYESLKFIWLTNLLSLKNNNYMNKFNSQFNIFIFSIENLSYIDFPFILSITLIHSFFNSHSNERAAARCSNVWLLLWALLYVFRYTFCQEQEMCIWSNNEQQWSVHFYTVTSCMCVCEYICNEQLQLFMQGHKQDVHQNSEQQQMFYASIPEATSNVNTSACDEHTINTCNVILKSKSNVNLKL